MRGKDEQQLDVFSYVSPEQRVPQDHPLRSLRAMTDEALSDLQPRFNRLCAKTGRPSIELQPALSQRKETWTTYKSRRPFFRSLLGSMPSLICGHPVKVELTVPVDVESASRRRDAGHCLNFLRWQVSK